MVNDMCKIVLDPVFKPKIEIDEADENGFELIFREEGV